MEQLVAFLRNTVVEQPARWKTLFMMLFLVGVNVDSIVLGLGFFADDPSAPVLDNLFVEFGVVCLAVLAVLLFAYCVSGLVNKIVMTLASGDVTFGQAARFAFFVSPVVTVVLLPATLFLTLVGLNEGSEQMNLFATVLMGVSWLAALIVEGRLANALFGCSVLRFVIFTALMAVVLFGAGFFLVGAVYGP